MSDRLPIFQITENKHNNKVTIIVNSKGLTNERNINTLINDLVIADWKQIYDSDDIICMYNTFTYYNKEFLKTRTNVSDEKYKTNITIHLQLY